jgi:hypothetical protein
MSSPVLATRAIQVRGSRRSTSTMKILVLVLLSTTISCTQNKRSSNETVFKELKQDSLHTDTLKVISVHEFNAQLNQLPDSSSSSLQGLELFAHAVSKSNQEENDKAFKAYLEFQASLIDKLNQQLMENPALEKIGSLIWADSSLHEEEGKVFARNLKPNGLQLASSEGMVYISRETEILRAYFYKFLTPSTKLFFNQFEIETNKHDVEDAALIIPVKELADRLAFWDNFLSAYPQHIFSEYAGNNIESDLYFLLIGLNNTPAFDYESKIVDPEFLQAYQYFIKEYPDTKSAQTIRQYLRVLEKAEYRRDDKVVSFTELYNPYKEQR